MGFWVALADPTQAGHPMVAATALQLSPAPTFVTYPEGRWGDEIATGDGRVVVQQGNRDSRVREWHWSNYPGFLRTYERQFQMLKALRSRYRFEVGASPYVYVKDDSTNLLRQKLSASYTLTGATTTTMNVFGQSWTVDQFAGGVVEVLPAAAGGSGTGAFQRARILSNTNSILTLDTALTTVPINGRVAITYWQSPYFRARLLDVDRRLIEQGGNVRYSDTVVRFVIDDDTKSPDLG
jgi:hypothetical protein